MRVWLKETNSQVLVDAAVVPMSPEHIRRAQAAWGEEFQRRRSAFPGNEDAMVWTRGVMSDISLPAITSSNGFVVIYAGEIQGVVLYGEQLQASRRAPLCSLLYVTYLATAPWNRRTDTSSGRFRQVGRVLVAESVRESVRRGCPGRIGLHSYPGSSQFYERFHFECLGADVARRGMQYFELRLGAAFHLLSDYGAPPETSVDNQ